MALRALACFTSPATQCLATTESPSGSDGSAKRFCFPSIDQREWLKWRPLLEASGNGCAMNVACQFLGDGESPSRRGSSSSEEAGRRLGFRVSSFTVCLNQNIWSADSTPKDGSSENSI